MYNTAHAPVPVFSEERYSEVVGTMVVVADPAEPIVPVTTLFPESSGDPYKTSFSLGSPGLFARVN